MYAHLSVELERHLWVLHAYHRVIELSSSATSSRRFVWHEVSGRTLYPSAFGMVSSRSGQN